MLDTIAAVVKGFGYLAMLGGAGIVIARATLPFDIRSSTLSLPMLVRAAGGLAILCGGLTAWLFVERLGGIADPAAIDAVLWSPLGAALALQLFGGAVLTAVPGRGIALIGAMALLLSFGVVGHSATLGLVTSATVLVHIGTASWWLGGLALLLVAGRRLSRADHILLVAGFSRQAIWVVSALVLAAATTAALLLDWTFDPDRAYDIGLAIKVGLTLVLLALAGINRFALLPRLTAVDHSRHWLGRTIAAELLIILGILATTAWLTSFQSPHEASHGEVVQPLADGPIAIIDAWAPASVSSLGTGAGYLTLVNNQQVDDRLVGASSPWAEAVSLHESQQDGSITRMQRVDALRLPAKGRVTFAPGGYHLMFTGLYAPLVVGDTVPVALKFERAGSRSVTLTVRALGDQPVHAH